MGVLGAKYGKGWCDIDPLPNKFVLTFGEIASVPNLTKLD